MRLKVSAAAALFVGFVQSSFGTTLGPGSFDFIGTIFVTTTAGVVTPAGTCPIGVACIFWQSSSSTSNGEVDITATSGGLSSNLIGNDNANISSLANPPEVVGSPFAPELFMSFAAATGVTTVLDIDYIYSGIYSSAQCSAVIPAVGQQCTLPGSEFSLVNNGPVPTATATWEFSGVTNIPGLTWTANFTAVFPSGTPYQTVLNEASTLGYVSIPFLDDGKITLTPTPEPGSMSLMIATGLSGLALSLRRRTAK